MASVSNCAQKYSVFLSPGYQADRRQCSIRSQVLVENIVEAGECSPSNDPREVCDHSASSISCMVGRTAPQSPATTADSDKMAGPRKGACARRSTSNPWVDDLVNLCCGDTVCVSFPGGFTGKWCDSRDADHAARTREVKTIGDLAHEAALIPGLHS